MKQKNVDNVKKKKKKKTKKRNTFKSFLIKLFIFVFLLSLIMGITFLVFKLYIFKTLAKEMFNNSPSIVYDSSKNLIAEIGAERNRKNVSFSNIPKQLVNAYIAIEDQRFYTHHGVDIKRTGAAILSYITKMGTSSFGGSTITQQLVKNLTGDDSNTINRKIKEWFYAWTLEIFFSKEEILEAYLNIIYTGPNIYGVDMAATYYFNKNLEDLSLAECAFIAGINNAPNTYNPFTENDRSEKIRNRTITVLNKMLELGYISQTEYDGAYSEVKDNMKFSKGEITTNNTIYSYHTDALISEIISDMSSQKFIPQDFATNFFYLSGSNVYSTENREIQDCVEEEFKKDEYILPSVNEDANAQAAMVIIDNQTGYVIASSGGLGEKTSSRVFNRSTQMKRQTGSSIKPLAVLLPALNEKIVTNASIFDDVPTTFTNYNGDIWNPTNYDEIYKGPITLREATESSQNIPFVKVMELIGADVSIKYLKEMGISSLTEKDVNLSLALGGLDQGISPMELAGGYTTIANNR